MPTNPARDSKDSKFRCWIFFGLIASVIVIAATQVFDWGNYNVLRLLCEKLAEAVFIAMVLALTVDMYLKRALAKDAVEAAIGYILPPYLQEEMVAIYSNEVVCIDHNQVVVLTELPNGLMSVRIRVERLLENISTAQHNFNPDIVVDEWLVDGIPCRIHECGYKKDDGEPVTAQVDSVKPMNGKLPRWIIAPPPINLTPKDRLSFWYDIEEIKRRSDMHVLQFRYSTNSPRVRVDAPPSISWQVEFAHRQNTKRERYSNVTVLPGLLLPHQCIFVRWWETAKEEAWRVSLASRQGAKTN
jgi:hypothetical protein